MEVEESLLRDERIIQCINIIEEANNIQNAGNIDKELESYYNNVLTLKSPMIMTYNQEIFYEQGAAPNDKDHEKNNEEIGIVDETNPEYIVVSPNAINIPNIEKEVIIGETSETKHNIDVFEDSICLEKKRIEHYVHIADRVVAPRALAVLPSALHVLNGVITPRSSLGPRVRFGPVEGVPRTVTLSEGRELISDGVAKQIPVFLCNRDYDSVTYMDTSDKDKSNWLGMLSLGDQRSANVWLYEEDGKLYGITTNSIESNTPLLLGYSKTYAEEYSIPEGQPVLDVLRILCEKPQRRWWCSDCHRSMRSEEVLQRHYNVFHKEVRPKNVRRYRCRHCSMTFSRLFILKRHLSVYCRKRNENIENVSKSDTVKNSNQAPSASVDSAQTFDETRIPSDESFQNYTNNIDFPINLFDTDRTPSLDMCRGFKSGLESNGCKDESCLSDEFGFGKLDDTFENCTFSKNERKKRAKVKMKENTKKCPNCYKFVEKGMQLKHQRKCCMRRLLECHCGRSYPNKEKLALHLHLDHYEDFSSEPSVDKKKESVPQYKCEECLLTFKRRGMLVNHLVRIHERADASVPLERRVRRYPCVACPKFYSSAAKRNLHVKKHHPGVNISYEQRVDGAAMQCPPASCTACPRQYTTRAKLMQHVRAHHPHLAAPAQKKKKRSQENSGAMTSVPRQT